MKKILSLLLLAVLGLSARAHAFDTAPYSQFINMPGAYGSTMLLQNHSTVGLGRYAGGNSWISVPFVTDVNLGYAQPVVITTNTSNGISVSGTTTVGDKDVRIVELTRITLIVSANSKSPTLPSIPIWAKRPLTSSAIPKQIPPSQQRTHKHQKP